VNHQPSPLHSSLAKRINQLARLLESRLGVAAHQMPFRSGFPDGGHKERVHLLPSITTKTETIGDPGDVVVADEIERRPTVGRGTDDPIGATAKKMAAVHGGAEEIGVMEEEPGCVSRAFILQGHLPAGDRPVIGELEAAAHRLGEVADEFRHELGRVVLGQLFRERSLAGALRSGDNHTKEIRADTACGWWIGDRIHEALCWR
jgi:hypothetical protein